MGNHVISPTGWWQEKPSYVLIGEYGMLGKTCANIATIYVSIQFRNILTTLMDNSAKPNKGIDELKGNTPL